MFRKLIEKILRKEKRAGRIDVVLVDGREIRKLNRKFRGGNRATDVLSFAYDEGDILGDVVVSKSYRREFKRLVIHGVLHILGYEHGRKMSHAEEIYAKF